MMTCDRQDRMNSLLIEICYSYVCKKEFDASFWMEHLDFKKQEVLFLDETSFHIFGLVIPRMKSEEVRNYGDFLTLIKKKQECIKTITELQDKYDCLTEKNKRLSEALKEVEELLYKQNELTEKSQATITNALK